MFAGALQMVGSSMAKVLEAHEAKRLVSWLSLGKRRSEWIEASRHWCASWTSVSYHPHEVDDLPVFEDEEKNCGGKQALKAAFSSTR